MAEEESPHERVDPVKPWRQWYQATVGAWSGALGNGDLDAFGFHRQWLADAESSAGDSRDTQEFVRQMAEATVESWRRAAEVSVVMTRLAPRWGELAGALRQQMLSGRPPTDPLDFSVRLYNATSGPLSGMIRDLLSDEACLGFSRRVVENYVTLESVAGTVWEDFFRRLRLSTSSDSARVAGLVVGLDEKVDRLEDAFEDLEDTVGGPAAAAEVAQLRDQVDRLEAKLDRLLVAAGTATNGGARAGGDVRRGRRAANESGDRKEKAQ